MIEGLDQVENKSKTSLNDKTVLVLETKMKEGVKLVKLFR